MLEYARNQITCIIWKGGADGEKNTQAGEGCPSSHTACARNWNSYRGDQHDRSELPISKGEGDLPNATISKSICKINMKKGVIKEIFKLVVAMVWFVIVVVGLFLIFT